jgi:hypothetical protein
VRVSECRVADLLCAADQHHLVWRRGAPASETHRLTTRTSDGRIQAEALDPIVRTVMSEGWE